MRPGIDRTADEVGRPLADRAYVALAWEIVRAAGPALVHVNPDRVLFLAGPARRGSLASIRPLTFGGSPPRDEEGPWKKPHITIGGRQALYEVVLRPRFFLDATPDERLAVLAHELWHASPAFDGTLAPERRHEEVESAAVEREVEALVEAWRAARDERSAAAILAHEGELRLDAWLSRPPTRIPRAMLATQRVRTRYDERDLFSAVVIQRTTPLRSGR